MIELKFITLVGTFFFLEFSYSINNARFSITVIRDRLEDKLNIPVLKNELLIFTPFVRIKFLKNHVYQHA